jgi:hypothetical protein
MLFILWLILAIISLPLAIIALLLYPLIWLLSIPFRIIGISVRGVFELIEGIIMLPGRLLKGGDRR